jgi:glycosyltransferase involved in cell wall biosynthesis
MRVRRKRLKVLLVNYYYHPMVDAHAYRWTQLSEHWAEKGFQVDVICSKVGNVEDLEYGKNIQVTRVGFFRAIKMQSKKNTGSENMHSRKGLVSALKQSLRLIYRKFYWPDGLWHWFFSVSGELFKRRSTKYDLVVSYSPTFTAHLAVMLFRKIAMNNSFWIADYGDPFSTSISMPNNNISLYGALNRWVESLVNNKASKICFTSQSTIDDYFSVFGVKDNAHVIPHMADVEKVYNEIKEISDPEVIRLVFVGNFHVGIREPFFASSIVEGLASFLHMKTGQRIVFDVYGASNGVDVASICSPIINWHGPLDRERVNEVIGSADFLVNIENMNCSMIPSKIVEYIATGKPIIDVAQKKKDVSKLIDLYAAEGGAIIIDEHFSSEFADLQRFLERYKGNGKISLDTINAILMDFGIGEVSRKYLEDIEGVPR